MAAQPRQHRAPSRTHRWLGVAVLAVLIGLVALGSAALLSGRYQVRPVLSGSMRPGLPVGGVVITERVPITSLRVRDVVVFHRPGQPQELVVHRIVSLTNGPNGPIIRTQGDANNAPDPWTVTLSGTTAYRAVYSLPLVGYAAVWVHGPLGRKVFMLVGLLLVATAAVSTVVSRRRTATRAGRSEAVDPPADTTDDDFAALIATLQGPPSEPAQPSAG